MIWIVLLLTGVWVAVTEDAGVVNVVAGLAISIGITLLHAGRLTLTGGGIMVVPRAIGLLLYLVFDLVRSNVRVVILVLRPRVDLCPGIVAVPIDLAHDWQVALLANLITLTPGSLTVEVSRDRKTLFVHDLVVEDPDEIRRQIKEGFERRIRGLAP